MLDFNVVTHFTRWRFLLILLAGITAQITVQTVLAQRCTDFVAVDGVLLGGRDAAACYFGAAEGAENAYVRTDLVTAALGLESAYLPETGQLQFEKGDSRVELLATEDVEAALSPRPDALVVGGEAEAGRSAILAGNSYLPLTEIVRAFGGTVSWNAAARLALVDFSAPVPATAPPAANDPAPSATPSVNTTQTPIDPDTPKLDAPRYAAHDEGYTRVAVDVPAGVTYRLAVDGDNFIVLFDGARAAPYEVTPNGAQLVSLGYRTISSGGAGGGVLALIAGTGYPLSAAGRGFEVGVLDSSNDKTLYVDFAPGLKGKKVAQLADLSKRNLAAVQRPRSVQKTVVIDPGHGGKDPGTLSDYVVEKDLVLGVGLLLRDKLESRGINVEMTRDDDTFVPLEDRAAFAVPPNTICSSHCTPTRPAAATLKASRPGFSGNSKTTRLSTWRCKKTAAARSGVSAPRARRRRRQVSMATSCVRKI